MRNDYLNAMAMVSMIVVFFVFGISRAEANEVEEFYVAPSSVVFDLEPVAEVGYFAAAYDENNKEQLGEYAKLGVKVNDTKFYMWASKDKPYPSIFGQAYGRAKLFGYGIGVGQEFGKWTIFMEGGKMAVDFDPYDLVVEEMARTVMLKNHDYEGRYHPGQSPNDPNIIIPTKWKNAGFEAGDPFETETNFKIKDPYVGKLGVAFEPIPHVSVYLVYRIAVADTELNMWDVGEGIPEKHDLAAGVADRSIACACWWLEEDTMSFSGWEMGIGIKW